jgi:hypothetical protein
MTVFRTTDLVRWGVGKGSNLTPTEVDRNFWDILVRLTAVEANPPTPISIASITTTATTFTVHLTNGATQGPFALPVAQFNLLGAWLPLHDYSGNVGSFITAGGETYIIQYPHTSAATFDPGANDGLGHNYYGLLPFPHAPIIAWLPGGWPASTAIAAYRLFSIPDVGVFLTLSAFTTDTTFDPAAVDGLGNPLYLEVFGAIETDRARIQFQFAGAPPSDSSVIMAYIQDDTRDLVFPTDFVDSTAHLEVAVTATLAWTITHGVATLGTITFTPGTLLDGTGGQFGVFTGTGGTVPSLDMLRIRAPGAADATAKFLTVSLIGTYS